MERVNLNVPQDTRARLKQLAASLGLTEAELVRQLVSDGLRRREREQLGRQIAEAMTPEFERRTEQIIEDFDSLEGGDAAAG